MPWFDDDGRSFAVGIDIESMRAVIFGSSEYSEFAEEVIRPVSSSADG